MKTTYTTMLLLIMLLTACAIPSQQIIKQDISDSEILQYEMAKFDKEEFIYKTVILGEQRGIKVIAEHPCSDQCPDYTIRIIRYDIRNEDCERSGGVFGYRIVPIGDAMQIREYCVPPILETIKINRDIYEIWKRRIRYRDNN